MITFLFFFPQLYRPIPLLITISQLFPPLLTKSVDCIIDFVTNIPHSRIKTWRSEFHMIDFVTLILVTLALVCRGFIVCAKTLRKTWIYVLITFIIFWGIIELIEYLNPHPPHYE